MSQQTKQTVWTVTNRIIFKLSNQKEETYDKATLAKIRKTLGKPLSYLYSASIVCIASARCFNKCDAR